MPKAVVVFSGYNQRAVIALLRTLTKKMVPFAIIASSPEDTIFQTTYGKSAIVRNSKELNIKDLLESLSRATSHMTNQSYLIAPSTESLNRFLLKHRDEFERRNFEIPLVDEVLYSQISDKKSFTHMCSSAGIMVPRDEQDVSSLELPFVAKPKKYWAADGSTPSPVLIHTPEERDMFVRDYHTGDFYFQEYIDGESHYLLYYVYADGRIDKFSQRNLVQQPDGKSVIAAITSNIHKQKISNQYEKLLIDSGYRGLIMIEVKINSAGKAYMIEANPRMWGPSQLFVDAQYDLFESLLYDYGVITQPMNSDTSSEITRYYWGGGGAAAGVDDDGLDYHGYSIEQLKREKSQWVAADIYNRDDTFELFVSETKGKI